MDFEKARKKARARNAPHRINGRYFNTVLSPESFGKPNVIVNDQGIRGPEYTNYSLSQMTI